MGRCVEYWMAACETVRLAAEVCTFIAAALVSAHGSCNLLAHTHGSSLLDWDDNLSAEYFLEYQGNPYRIASNVRRTYHLHTALLMVQISL